MLLIHLSIHPFYRTSPSTLRLVSNTAFMNSTTLNLIYTNQINLIHKEQIFLIDLLFVVSYCFDCLLIVHFFVNVNRMPYL